MKERGLTLVEILVALAVLGMILASVYGIAILQQRSYAVQGDIVLAQQNARRVIHTLESLIRNAGFGVDPPIAFDFSYYCCQGGFINPDTCPSPSAPPACRDRINAPDEIVFLQRDPNPRTWGRVANISVGADGALSEAEVCFPGSVTEAGIRRGTILLFMCDGAAGIYNYVVVDTVDEAGPHSIRITPYNSTQRTVTNLVHPGTSDTFMGNAVVSFDNSCFQNVPGVCASPPVSGPWVFPIRLWRLYIHVEDVDHDGIDIEDPHFLMLDPGTVNPDTGHYERIPVAQDVEDIQVAYILERAKNDPVRGVTGEEEGVQEEPNPNDYTGCEAYPTYFEERKYYTIPLNDPCRTNNTLPANIRGIRITLVMRTPERDPDLIGVDKPSLQNPIENRRGMDASAARAYPFRRIVLSTTIFLPNMLSTAQFGAVQSP